MDKVIKKHSIEARKKIQSFDDNVKKSIEEIGKRPSINLLEYVMNFVI